MRLIIWVTYSGFVLLYLGTICSVASDEAMTEYTTHLETKGQLALKEKARTAEKIEAKQKAEIEQLDLPEDTSSRFTVRELRISGNNLISTEELLKNMP